MIALSVSLQGNYFSLSTEQVLKGIGLCLCNTRTEEYPVSYRAVTIQSPSATLAAKSVLPASKIKKPTSSLFCFSTIKELRVASRKEFNIHWPSKAKQGTALITASAPESEIKYLQNVSITTGRSMLRKLCRGTKLLRLTVY